MYISALSDDFYSFFGILRFSGQSREACQHWNKGLLISMRNTAGIEDRTEEQLHLPCKLQSKSSLDEVTTTRISSTRQHRQRSQFCVYVDTNNSNSTSRTVQTTVVVLHSTAYYWLTRVISTISELP